MEGSAPGRTVAPDQAADDLRAALAARDIHVADGDVHPGEHGRLTLSIAPGFLVVVEADCYRWPYGTGLQIHPLTDPQGAATLIADALESDVTWRIGREHPGWLILRSATGALVAVPLAARLETAPVLRASTPADLVTAIRQAEAATQTIYP